VLDDVGLLFDRPSALADCPSSSQPRTASIFAPICISIGAYFYCTTKSGESKVMTENYRTGLIWNLMRRCPPVVTGLPGGG
jgi:hypothetical protein